MKKLLLLIVTAAAITACQTKEKEVEIEKMKPKLVIQSQLIPNRVMLLTLTRSFSILEKGYTPETEEKSSSADSVLMKSLFVDSALVTVSYRNKVDTLFMLYPGFFSSIKTLQYANENYTLKVIDYRQNLEASSTEKMLPKVKFDQVNCKKVNNTLGVSYSFTDNPSEENYYLINVYYEQINVTKTKNKDYELNNYFINSSGKLAESIVLTDKLFSNSKISGEFASANFNQLSGDTVAVTLSNISKEYYNYIEMRKKSENLFSLAFKEPINYPTNVNGGYGFFLTHHPDIHFFKLK